jgi:hypothetical protein
MRKELLWERIQKLEEQRDFFLYGSSAAPSGAFFCFDLLNKYGMEVVSYTTIAACSEVMAQRAMSAPFISQYCLPKLVRAHSRT